MLTKAHLDALASLSPAFCVYSRVVKVTNNNLIREDRMKEYEEIDKMISSLEKVNLKKVLSISNEVQTVVCCAA